VVLFRTKQHHYNKMHPRSKKRFRRHYYPNNLNRQ